MVYDLALDWRATIDRGSRVRVTGRNLGYFGAATAAFLVGAAASAQSVSPNVAPVLVPAPADDVAAFYATFRPQPIWTRAGVNEAAVAQLVAILQRAPFDGFADGPQLATQVQAAVAQARSGDPAATALAEHTLSAAWVRYVQFLKRPTPGMTYAQPL